MVFFVSRKNAQNDIIALLDKEGNVVVKYMYDAWGVCDTIVLNENATDIANLNPFRYRSYYLDTRLNLYYLKTRYYDPEICRFITIDDISYLAPDTINGLNLYAYCLNNPVTYFDETGRFAEGLLFQFVVSALCYVGFSIASIWDNDIKSDMNRIGWNPLNSNTGDVVASQKVSFYKGVPVLRLNLPSSFSFGIMFLDNAGTGTADDTTVKHEYGHSVQQMIIGPQKYFNFIAVPSLLMNAVFAVELLFTGNITNPLYNVYFDLPFERSADLFGGVLETDRKHSKWSSEISLFYLAFLLLM